MQTHIHTNSSVQTDLRLSSQIFFLVFFIFHDLVAILIHTDPKLNHCNIAIITFYNFVGHIQRHLIRMFFGHIHQMIDFLNTYFL